MRAFGAATQLALSLALTSQARGQQCPFVSDLSTSARGLAEHFAPIFDFAPGENYFPTIPFFTAFDSPGSMRDPDKIAPIYGGRRVSWDTLNAAYQRRLSPHDVPAESAVFFDVRPLAQPEVSTLWTFLKNDPQAWQRLGVRELYESGLKYADFQVIQYYSYYVRDAGLQGHENDIEKVFVFLPRTSGLGDRLRQHLPEIRRRAQEFVADSVGNVQGRPPDEMADSLARALRIIVGAGHSSTTPNNVLVLTGTTARCLQNPGVLVERGGHSSAPNMRPSATFNIGLDVNWNISENVWGTRDVQAIAGSGYFGDYKEWMTVPRDPATSVKLVPALRGSAARAVKVAADSMANEQSGQVGSDTTAPRLERGYALLPVPLLQQLVAATVRDTSAHSDSARNARRAEVTGLVDSLGRLIAAASWNFGGFAGMDSVAIDTAIHRMAYWNQPMGDRRGHAIGQEHRIWETELYRGDPTGILKRSLFRPASNSVQNLGDVFGLLTAHFDVSLGGRGQQFLLGITIPSGLLIGKIIYVPGILELQAGIYRRTLFGGSGGVQPSVSLLYERRYRATFSWFLRGNYVHDRAEVSGDPTARDFGFSFGPSIMPGYSFVDRLPDALRPLARVLRIRPGVRVELHDWEPTLRQLELQFTVSTR